MVFNFLTSLGLRPSNIEAALPLALANPAELVKHVSTSTQKVAKHVQNWFEAHVASFFGGVELSAKAIKPRPDLSKEEILTELKAQRALFFAVPEMPNPAQAPKPIESSVLKLTSFDFVQAFVENHLHPYLTGEITAENEDKERPTLFSIFLPLYKKQFPNSLAANDSLQELLLKAYVREAVCGINRKFECLMNPTDFTVEMLCAALKPALSIDFKGRDFSESEIQALAKEALQSILESSKSAKMEITSDRS